MSTGIKRRCKCTKFVQDSELNKKVTKTYEGDFHQWGIDFAELVDGVAEFSVGIIELDTGEIITAYASDITFIDKA